jgi:hypothetical protein
MFQAITIGQADVRTGLPARPQQWVKAAFTLLTGPRPDAAEIGFSDARTLSLKVHNATDK